MIKKNNLEKTEKFAGENFSSEKYFNDLLEGLSFSFLNKRERLKDVKNIIKKTEENNNVNYSKYVDILLGNYEIFINIGKYVDKIDKSVTQTIAAQKDYSNLLSSLRKDIEEFSFSFSKYLKTMKEEEGEENSILNNNKNKNKGVYTFEPVDDIELMEENFDFDDFLNPKEGSEKWLSENIEKVKMLIDEKKYDECINLILMLRKNDLSKLDYNNCIILDEAYNELIEKLTLSIGKCSTISEVQFYLNKMKILGCESLAVDTFLSWLSRKLKNRTQKKIIGEDDYDFISNEKGNIKNSLSISGSKSFNKKSNILNKSGKNKNENLNIIKEEDEEVIKEEDEENEIKNEEIVDKNEIDTNEIINLINNKEHNIDKTIINIINDYFNNLIKSLEIMNDYFNIKTDNAVYSTYIIPWLRQEILSMNKQLENLFGKVRTINELTSILNFISELFSKMDLLGQSAKFIYDMYFIKNLNISLISIISYCLKVNITGVPFDLKNYNINFNNNNIPLLCVSELSPSVYNISILISEFITKYSNMKKRFIGIIFLEENLFDSILNKEFFPFIKNKITKNISNNYDLMPFTDNNESMAPSNQTLINYGITILSIEKFFISILKNPLTQRELNKSTLENIEFFLQQFNEEKNNYFDNLLKVKMESHFYKFFDNQSGNYSKNISYGDNSKFTGPDKGFLSFFQLLKNVTKMIKFKTINNKDKYSWLYFVEYFIMNSIYNNFLKVVHCLKNLNEVYESEFNLSKVGTNGMEHIIYGIYFVYFSLKMILNLDVNGQYLNITRNFIDEILGEWSQMINMPCDRFIQNKNNYEKNVQQYIFASKSQLSQGFQ